ncbi:hypothetical protein KZZ07_13065 [Mameliella sp. CS4]|nr:hypothetical protein [Mameliella sp. CS4]
MKPRAIRREARTLAGRFRGGKLAPVMAVPFVGSESGSVTQSITYELDPIAGRMITEVTAEIISVFVPLQAIDAQFDDTNDYPGNAEVLRQKLLAGTALYALEPENEITKRLGVVPSPVSGVKYVCASVRHAHNAAVNYLRRRKHVDAAQVPKGNSAITPAIISQNVLDRLNGVLDPEDRVNGAVQFDGVLNVEGFAVKAGATTNETAQTVVETGQNKTYANGFSDNNSSSQLIFEANPQDNARPNLRVDLGGASTISLTDMYQAEKMDQLTRQMREMVDQHPELGDELVARFAHGLSVDPGRQPFVVYEQRKTFNAATIRAMDGASLDQTQTNMVVRHDFTAPIPASEFGGILITFAAVKPDETLASQPHPILSKGWKAQNFAADELAIDPVPVRIRELDADCDPADENTIALYVGNNGLRRTYVNYGFNRHLDPTTVEAKTAIWQLEVPMSVTPESVLYPNDLGHYPFAVQAAEVCTYTCSSLATINTPTIFGPTPVEELAAIETDDVFNDA